METSSRRYDDIRYSRMDLFWPSFYLGIFQKATHDCILSVQWCSTIYVLAMIHAFLACSFLGSTAT